MKIINDQADQQLSRQPAQGPTFTNVITGTQAGVAHFAHLGGALIGWLLIWWWYKRRKNNNNNYVHY